MIRLSSILKKYEHEFIDSYKQRLLPSHCKAIGAIKDCRSIHSPKILLQCENNACAHQSLIPHSCGHRHCPHCQNHETQQWIDKQLQKQLPADYFMITFTVPKQLRPLAWQHQRLIYGLLFECAWDTLKVFCLNDKKLCGMAGAIAVLHTHSRELFFHPHIHMVMPAAAIDKKKRLWRVKESKYLFNHKALAKTFRAKMLDAFVTNGLKRPQNLPKEWVVDCKKVGRGNKALLYLGQYLYRGVIKEKDIISCENGKVTFRYKSSKSNKTHYKTIDALHFLWMVFQHILPRGFRRARNYGFLHSNSKKLIRLIQLICRINLRKNTDGVLKRKRIKCPCCQSFMNIIQTRLKPAFMLRKLNPL